MMMSQGEKKIMLLFKSFNFNTTCTTCTNPLCIVIVALYYSTYISANPQPGQKRISSTKCDEYKEIYREYYESPLPPPFDEKELGDLKCPQFKEPFIVGGRDAFLDEFPHMASLQYKLSDGSFHHGCGGTLISNQYVLTAAHCVNAEIAPGVKKSPEKIILGDISLVRNNERSKRKEMSVSNIKIHPEYNPIKSSYHDIALIKLAGDIKLDYNARPPIRPACLAQPEQHLEFNKATATGWGKISDYSDVQNILQAANLTVENNVRCGEVYSDLVLDFRSRFPKGIRSDLICAGEKNKDTCLGDSGGPLTVTPLAYLPCMDFIVGITSVGPSNCGQGTPGIYTRVEKYIDWIEDNVWKNP